MEQPAFRLQSIMALIVVASLDIAVLFLGFRFGNQTADSSLRVGLLLLGTLPMLNVLGLGLWIGRRSPSCRGFFRGFNLVAALEAVLLAAATILIDAHLLRSYFDPFGRFVQEKVFGRTNFFTKKDLLFLYMICSATFVTPQVVLASMGGLLSHQLGKATRQQLKNAT